jgi:hypothetical protein
MGSTFTPAACPPARLPARMCAAAAAPQALRAQTTSDVQDTSRLTAQLNAAKLHLLQKQEQIEGKR